MDQNETSAIVALIPQDDSWCKIESAHMTIVYIGETDELSFNRHNEIVKDVVSLSMLSGPIMTKIIGHDIMGEEEKVDVFRISSTPELLSIRRFLQKWNTGEFIDFEPHVTIGPEGSWNSEWTSQSMPIPMYLTFDRISVFWGKDRLDFWLRKY